MQLSRILRTKIIPPQRGPRILPRQRINQTLMEALDYRLTLLLAGAGFGKSTALGELADVFQPLIWYQVTSEDSDALIFLLHLCHATRLAFPDLEGLPTPHLESWDVSQITLPLTRVIDQYINALSEKLDRPTLLILDDAPLITEATEIAHILDRLIGLSPTNLHIVLAGRPPITLPNLSRWRLRGEVLTIDQSVLAFNEEEINLLFGEYYGHALTPEEVKVLLDYTEGWAIALQLIWQSLRSESATSLNGAISRQRAEYTHAIHEITRASPDKLFEVLAYEVFERQPKDIQDFLLLSSTLWEMTPEACDALLSTPEHPSHDSAAMLAYLRRQELFVVEQSDGSLRYHKVFHDFLRQQAPLLQQLEWHGRAAAHYQSQQNTSAAIYHLIEGQAWEKAANLLDTFGEQLLASGRLDTLVAYLEAIPPTILHQHPALLFYLGDLARLRSRFQEALGWYQQAEIIWRTQGYLDGIGRALRGQARVYLDTVDPSQAEKLLEQAIRLSDGIESRDSQARLYELLAENRLNAGQPEEAERFRQQATALRYEGPSDSQLIFRVLLRTGRLEEARRGLEERTQTERDQPVYTPRAHRETFLLLSLVDSFQGRAERALQTAIEGTQRGTTLDSPFITAVGHMRQGHALTLPLPDKSISTTERYELARQQYEKSIEISRTLVVPRLRVEADWGLCRVYGYQGDLARALKVAQEGIEIATQAGDEWVASLVRLAMGSSLVLAARYEAAEEWLGKAGRSFHECGDPFGKCVTRLWLCLGLYRQKEQIRLEQILPEVLASCREGSYDFLFTRPTLLGPPEVRSTIPLLILARDRGWERHYASRLLESLGVPGITLHPGYQLRVYALGTFKVWRGDEQVPGNSWNREKARQLFQFLLTYRKAPLRRDQIAEALWPDLDPTTSQRNFRNVLNALYHVLEPEREPGSESAYVIRDGSTYALRPSADLWLDAEVFLTTLQQAEAIHESTPDEAISLLRDALDLYQGEYLPDARYETWTAAERERLAVLFLQNADRLSDLLLERGQYEEVIKINQRILTQDNCWERAYRHLMIAYGHLGDRGQVGRIYERCVQTLYEELEVAPSAETEALYQELAHKS